MGIHLHGEYGSGEIMGQHVGYAAGAFDFNHVGHLSLLRRTHQRSASFTTGVLSSNTLRRFKDITTVARAEIARAFIRVAALQPAPTSVTQSTMAAAR